MCVVGYTLARVIVLELYMMRTRFGFFGAMITLALFALTSNQALAVEQRTVAKKAGSSQLQGGEKTASNTGASQAQSCNE